MAGDKALTLAGLVVDELGRWFNPEGPGQAPPVGGKVPVVHVLVGSDVSPPAWMAVGEDEEPSCEGCDAFLWVRFSGRWRSDRFPAGRGFDAATLGGGRAKPAISLEVGIARCHPLDPDPAEEMRLFRTQLDDSWRIDQALCNALTKAEDRNVATHTAIGTGEPYGPEGLVLVWTQTAQAQL